MEQVRTIPVACVCQDIVWGNAKMNANLLTNYIDDALDDGPYGELIEADYGFERTKKDNIIIFHSTKNETSFSVTIQPVAKK